MKKALVYFVAFVCIQLAVALAFPWCRTLITGTTDVTGTTLALTALVTNVVVMAVFLGARWCRLGKSYLRSAPYDALFWCVVAAVGAIVPSAWLQEQLPELPNVVVQQMMMIMQDKWGYIVIGLLAPVAEEIVMRGAILRALLAGMEKVPAGVATAMARHRHWVAIAISAALFALAHGNPAQMPHALVVGLLLGWMYWRTGSIVPGVVYHWVNNTAAYAMFVVYPDPDATLSVYFGGNGRAVLLAVAFSLLILVPAIYQLGRRLHKA